MDSRWYQAGLAYMRVEEPDDMVVARANLDAAVAYLSRLGIPDTLAGEDPFYDLCAHRMALYWHDHRDDPVQAGVLPEGVRQMVTALKITYGVV